MGDEMHDMGRFSEPALLVLTSLASGEKHGYVMIEDIKEIYGVELGAGTLYGAISRLEKRGLIEPVPSEDRRRPYRITAVGAAQLQTQLQNLRRFTAVALQRLAAR